MLAPTAVLLLTLPAMPQSKEAPVPICPPTVEDAVTGSCLEASKVPTLGRLFTLTSDFMVDAATGFVGLGTIKPQSRLQINAISAPWADVAIASAELSGTGSIGIQVESVQGTAILGVSDENWGVQGYTEGAPGVAGVLGSSATTVGVEGYTTGPAYGVMGYGPNGGGTVGWGEVVGVRGELTGTSDDITNAAVSGEIMGVGGTGVWGEGNALHLSDGVRGVSHHPFGYGVWGVAEGDGTGVIGTSNGLGFGVYSEGDLVTTGVKNFAHPHPSDPARELRFVCLEGNESGTYFRGSAKLVGGRAVVAVPEEFRLVTSAEGLTVQLTAVGARTLLWVESRDLDRVVVRGDHDVDFDYQVNGVREAYGDYRVQRPNRSFRPRIADEPFGAHLRPEVRALLVQNGILNPDFTPNRATAAAQGWDLVEREHASGRALPRPVAPVDPSSNPSPVQRR